MNQDTLEALRLALDRIQDFNRECEEAEYTDTGDAWDVIGQAHDAIEAVFTPTKNEETARPEYRCDTCGGHRLHRCFYVWADAVSGHFYLSGAEATDWGNTADWYCLDCGENTLASIPDDIHHKEARQ